MELNQTHEIHIRPFWRIHSKDFPSGASSSGTSIILGSGDGWGDGSHETTQLCLQAIGHFHPRKEIHALDFGSGSGILSVAIAKLGGRVDGVEIDPAGIEHARVNAQLNCVENLLRFSEKIETTPKQYDWVVANILRPVLIEYAEELTRALKPEGTLILSGIVATDVPILAVRYSGLLGGREPEIFRRGDWCCMVWRHLTQRMI